MDKTPILTTGATGLVGSRFIEMFQDKYEFHNMDLTTGVDITDKNAIEEFVKNHPAKTLIHLAAFTDVNAMYEQDGDKDGIAYRVNVGGTQNIAEVCQKEGIYMIHVSTDFVFSGEKGEYTEEDEKSPIEWYGKTKAMAEDIVEDTLSEYCIVRIGYPFRASFEGKPDLVSKVRTGLEEGSLYPQFSDMTITPTYIDDFARALDSTIEKKPVGILHLHGSTSLSPFELAKKVARVFGFDENSIKEGSLEEYLKTTSRPYQKSLKMANKKAKEVLGITLSTVDEALEDIKRQLKG